MAFGARQEDDVWRLCERKGRTILYASKGEYPKIEIRFAGRTAAQKCAEALNKVWWPLYDKRRQLTSGSEIHYGMLRVILDHGGITADQFLEMTK